MQAAAGTHRAGGERVEAAVPSCLRTFGRDDYPDHVPNPGHFPLVVTPIIGSIRLSRVPMDGGSRLNIVYFDTLDRMKILRCHLRPSETPFYKIILGMQVVPLRASHCPLRGLIRALLFSHRRCDQQFSFSLLYTVLRRRYESVDIYATTNQ